MFAIKQVGAAVPDKQVRADLLNVLLDGRYRLAQAIDQPPAPGGPDPVRVLFLDQWRQLRDVVRKAAARGLLGDRALEFLSFLSAGDALMAFDQAAPALGARISAADLRRLARIMAPNRPPIRSNSTTRKIRSCNTSSVSRRRPRRPTPSSRPTRDEPDAGPPQPPACQRPVAQRRKRPRRRSRTYRARRPRLLRLLRRRPPASHPTYPATTPYADGAAMRHGAATDSSGRGLCRRAATAGAVEAARRSGSGARS